MAKAATVKKEEPEMIIKEERNEVKPITAEEQAIAARVMAEGQEWQTLTEGDIEDYDLMRDPFELPPPAIEKLNKKEFFFRWITRNQQRLDEMRSKQPPFRYWICNSTNTPFLKGYFDPVLGCVTREDQMLVFKPYWMFLKERQIKEGMAKALDQSGDITMKNGQVDGNYEWTAGTRSVESPKRLGTEVVGSDLIIGDIEDHQAGKMVSDSDLVVDE